MIVIVKIGTSSLTDDEGAIVQPAIAKLCAEVAAVRDLGHDVVIVSSGAIGAGLPVLGLGGDRRPRDAVTLQAVSAVGQSRLVQVYNDALARHGLVAGQVLLTPLDLMVRRQYLQARGTLARLLELGVVPVVNENDAIADDEIRFGDNDRIAALVAHLVGALPRRGPLPPVLQFSANVARAGAIRPRNTDREPGTGESPGGGSGANGSRETAP